MRVLADRYELGEEIGAGGMARVVVAHDTVLDRPVAVKLLGDSPSESTRERFMREARTAAQLRHPSAVAVYDTGEDAGHPYIVMELVEGGSLAALLREQGQLDVEEAVAITASVLEALAAAHASGLVHRDVKPANVLLPNDGGVKLSDFGIAKAMDDASEGLTATGSVMGTPTYLAPELVEGAAASPRSDLYSVGCMLYAQLAGRPPFTEGGPLAVAYAHRNEPVPPLEALRPGLPDDLIAVVERALAKDPDDRFADAGAMRAALLGDTPIAAADDTVRLGPDAAPAAADDTRVLDHGGHTATGEARRRRRRAVVILVVLLALLVAGAWAVFDRSDPDEPLDDEVVEDEAPPDEPEDEPDGDAPTPDDDGPDDAPDESPPDDTPDDTPDDGDAPPDDADPPDETPEPPADDTPDDTPDDGDAPPDDPDDADPPVEDPPDESPADPDDATGLDDHNQA